jgi:hypothetical protein
VDRAAKRKRRKNLNLHDEIKESGGTVCAPHVGPWHQPNEDQQRPTVAETASGKDPVQEKLKAKVSGVGSRGPTDPKREK